MKRIITSEPDTLVEYLSKIWQYRSLIMVFAKRDLKVKYAQTWLGLGWTIVQPITGMIIFTFFFIYVLKTNIVVEIPYHLFCFSGFMCWLLFSNIISGAGISLMQEEHLIKKVYFPRIIIPSAKTLNYLIDFLFSYLVLIFISVFYDFNVVWRFPFTVPAVLLILMNGFTIALWLSALTMKFRDFNHFIPYLINFGIWLTPVFFPLQLLPDKVRFIVEINPMTYAIELFRSLLYGLQLPHLSLTFIVVQITMVVLFFFGLKYFIKIDKLLSDYL